MLLNCLHLHFIESVGGGAFIIEGRTVVIIQTKQTKKGCLKNTFAEKYVINSLKNSEFLFFI